MPKLSDTELSEVFAHLRDGVHFRTFEARDRVSELIDKLNGDEEEKDAPEEPATAEEPVDWQERYETLVRQNEERKGQDKPAAPEPVGNTTHNVAVEGEVNVREPGE